MAEAVVDASPREAAAGPRAPAAEPRMAEAPPVATASPRARERRAVAIAIVVLATVAGIGLLRWAAGFFIPFVAGILLAYALRPVTDVLVRARVPRPVSATVVLMLVVGALASGIYALGDDFERAVATLPDAARKIRVVLERSRQQAGPIAYVQEAAKELEKAAADPAAKKAPAKPPAEPAVALQFQQYVLKQAASAMGVLAEIGLAILLAYFLLLAGDAFRRKLMHFVGPSLARKRMTIEMLNEIDAQVQRYMFVTMVTNVVVAVAVAALATAAGLEQPIAWGIAAGLLHFVPYAGAVMAGAVLAVGALLQFDSPLRAVAIGAGTLLVVATIGMVFQTWLQSRASQVNAVAIFVGLLFFAWLWGPWGIVLGAPLIAVAKTVADRVAEPIGHLLG
jgi:predicted PurR-regulated permease PerM